MTGPDPSLPLARPLPHQVRPACLLVMQDGMPMQSAGAAALLDWIRYLRAHAELTVAVGMRDATAYAALRRACARIGVTVVGSPGDPLPAAIAGQQWDCVELACWTMPAPALPVPWPRRTALVTGWYADQPPPETAAGGMTGDHASRLAALQAAILARRGNPAQSARPRRILQVTPTHFAASSTIGGGERYVDNLRRAVAAVSEGRADCPLLSCGPAADSVAAEGVQLLPGDVAQPDSFDPVALDGMLLAADAVHVHQCLTRFGLFVAARARLLGRPVIGTDHGGGQAPFLNSQPHLMGLFDIVQTYSAFGDLSAYDLPAPVLRLPGPVDDALFTLAADGGRDPALAVSIGRILPHKGFEAAIAALPAAMHLVIAGRPADPAYLDHLHTLAQGRDVRFEHTLDDPALLAVLGRAGLCVQVSTHRDYLGRTIAKPELLGLAPLEALCTGLPTIVSGAGSLGELGVLPGCTVAASPAELATLMDRHARGDLPHPPGQAIRAAAVAQYGLVQFGRRYLAMADGLLR